MQTTADWLELLSEKTRSFTDEYGSFLAWLEGRTGGETVLVWLPQEMLGAALPQLPRRFKGRLVLGLDASDGHAAPLERAVHWVGPRKIVLIQPGRGIASSFAGGKQTEDGGWADLSDERPARRLEVAVSEGFGYLEVCDYPAWGGPAIEGAEALEGSRLGGLGWARGIPTYGVGLDGLEQSLKTLFEHWRLL
ncbi:MAG: hypothetical protein SFU83_19100 [Meiothermus sp.]|nr:hypothetical protein [Meiothermus sp.]